MISLTSTQNPFDGMTNLALDLMVNGSNVGSISS